MPTCKKCGGTDTVKAGLYEDTTQRYQCKSCKSYRMEVDKGNILIIPDLHLPFEHPNALEFIKWVKSKYSISNGNIYSAGDIIDNNTLNFHEKDPDGISATEEIERVRGKIALWGEAFPEMKIASGNHGRLLERRAKSAGLPSAYIKDILEVLGAPKGWKRQAKWDINEKTMLTHGVGFGGKYGYARACESMFSNVIIGHLHATAGIYYTNTERGLLWGMSVGSLINYEAYVYDYARFNPRRPINSCGVIRADGTPVIEILKEW